MPFPIAPVIAGVSSLANLFGRRYDNRKAVENSRYNTDRTIEHQKELAEYAYQKDLEMWRRQNEYNNPAQQMSRLKSAGLNPNLVYGSGSVVGNSSNNLPKYNAPNPEYNYEPVQSGVPGTLNEFANLALVQAQTNNVKANQKNIETRTINEAVRTGLMKHQTAKAAVQANLAEQLAPYQAEAASQQNFGRAYDNHLKWAKAKHAMSNAENDKKMKDLKVELQTMRNKWEAVGVTPRDKLYVRALIRMLPQLGLDLDFMRTIFGEKNMKLIMSN